MQDAGWVMANGGFGSLFSEDHWNKVAKEMDEVYDAALGLHGYILRMDRPYADQNAMADIEGRPRPVRSIGIDRSSNPYWRNSVTP